MWTFGWGTDVYWGTIVLQYFNYRPPDVGLYGPTIEWNHILISNHDVHNVILGSFEEISVEQIPVSLFRLRKWNLNDKMLWWYYKFVSRSIPQIKVYLIWIWKCLTASAFQTPKSFQKISNYIYCWPLICSYTRNVTV